MNNHMKSAPAVSSRFISFSAETPKETVVNKEPVFKDISQVRAFMKEKGLDAITKELYEDRATKLWNDLSKIETRNQFSPSENYDKLCKELGSILGKFVEFALDENFINDFNTVRALDNYKKSLARDLNVKKTPSDSLEVANRSASSFYTTVDFQKRNETLKKVDEVVVEFMDKAEALLVKYGYVK